MKLIIFSRYSNSQASTRVRFLQYIPALIKAEIDVEIVPIINDDSIFGKSNIFLSIFSRIRSVGRVIQRLLQERKLNSFIHIHIELFPWLPFFFEWGVLLLANKKNYGIELDDAWFHRYNDHKHSLIRLILKNKIENLMSRSAFVIAGNQYIADRAILAGAKQVHIIPTVVDTEKYFSDSLKLSEELPPEKSRTPIIGWIGSPATTKFLLEIDTVIIKMHNENIARFITIGADNHQLSRLPIETISWSEANEISNLHNFDIGIMPLTDSLFEKGKCGYKLIQYMACGLPVVASPIGVNNTIVEHGKSGFLATTKEEWFNFLSQLCSNIFLRRQMGQIGLEQVNKLYSLTATTPKVVSIFIDNLGTKKNHEQY